MGKNRKCTTCGLSVKGHNGPTGKKCESILEDSYAELSDHAEQNKANPQQPGVGSYNSDTGTQYAHCEKQQSISTADEIKKLTALVQGMQTQINQLALSQTTVNRGESSALPMGTATIANPPVTANGAAPGVGCTVASNPVPAHHSASNTVIPPLGASIPGLGTIQTPWTAPGAARGIPSTQVAAPCGINISDKTALTALRGEYIRLDEFLTQYNFDINDEEYKSVVDNEGNVTVKPKKRKRVINSFARWEEAYTNYERLMVYYGGYEMYDQMVRYRVYIASVNRKYKWQAVAMYDARHRLDLAHRNSCQFAHLNSDLANTIFDSTAIKPNAPRCPRCSAYDHVEVAECPFPPRAAAAATKKPQFSFGGLGATATEICNNFNEGRCKWNEKCRRIHMCIRCKGPHPARDCTKAAGATAVSTPS